MFLSLISTLLLATMSVMVLSFLNLSLHQPTAPVFFAGSQESSISNDLIDSKSDRVEIQNHQKSVNSIKQLPKTTVNTFEDLWSDASPQVSNQAVTFTGWLAETNGIGVADTVIKLSSPYKNKYYSAVTDENGDFSFGRVTVGDHYQISVDNHEKYKPLQIEKISIAADTWPMQVILEPLELMPLEAVVVDSYGGYVSNLKIKIRSLVNSLYDTEVTTDNFGRFKLIEFPVGEIYFSTESPLFFEVKGIHLSALNGYGIVVPVNIGMQQISGWVQDENGLPIVAARVMLDAESKTNGIVNYSLRTMMTDESGHFEFKDLAEGEHYVTIHAKGFISQGVGYNTGSRIDQLYFQLLPGDESQITSETLKLKHNQAKQIF